jgi:hexosaminidase
MIRIILLLLFFPLFSCTQGISIIPRPSKVEYKEGLFSFAKGVSIKMSGDDEKATTIERLFAEGLFASKEWKAPASTEHAKNVVLQLLPGNGATNDESYRLRVYTDSVLIQARSYTGLYYGCQSAIQLFINSVLTYQVPCVEITDTPQYVYRGMHLDVCRHFFPKEVIKQYLNLMGQLKMNIFHWHLTDDQGWRIEIKKYPLLTEKGAWRTEKDGKKYGGYYTQADIKEIVAYAAERYITIVPEIEMPGHSTAAVVAYPWLCCNPNPATQVPVTWGIKKDIYCPTDSTFGFLNDVLDEVSILFPGPYVHLGGDEAPKDEWKKSSVAQALIKKEGLKNEEELQHYFMKRMEDHLLTKGKRCIGWGEIVKGGLSDKTIVMSWLDKSAGIKAMEHGNQVIMTPRFYCYFDYPQNIKTPKQAWWMVYLPLNKVYRFKPLPASANGKRDLVLGGQANVWTEYITNEKELNRQIMPRLAAMAEALWSKEKDIDDFRSRLKVSGNMFKVTYH